MKKILVVVLATILFGLGCANTSIEGTWNSTNPTNPSKITFKNGIVSGENFPAEIHYRLVEEAEPKRIYLRIKNEQGETIESPFAIYKIENDKLVLKFATEYVQTLGIITTGSRYEFPESFTGEIEVLERIQ